MKVLFFTQEKIETTKGMTATPVLPSGDNGGKDNQTK